MIMYNPKEREITVVDKSRNIVYNSEVDKTDKKACNLKDSLAETERDK